MTKGIKTSEFWTIVTSTLLGVSGQLKDVPEVFIKAGAVVIAAYVISRGLAKRGVG